MYQQYNVTEKNENNYFKLTPINYHVPLPLYEIIKKVGEPKWRIFAPERYTAEFLHIDSLTSN